MKQEELQFIISIGETHIQDIENGIVNFGLSAQQRIIKGDCKKKTIKTRFNEKNTSTPKVSKNG